MFSDWPQSFQFVVPCRGINSLHFLEIILHFYFLKNIGKHTSTILILFVDGLRERALCPLEKVLYKSNYYYHYSVIIITIIMLSLLLLLSVDKYPPPPPTIK